jgi:hypothetical protein
VDVVTKVAGAMSVEESISEINQVLPPAPVSDPSGGALPEFRGVRKTPREALRSLFQHDCVRLSRLFETVQASALYGVLVLFLGAAIDRAFQNLYPVRRRDYAEGAAPPARLTGGEFVRTLFVALAQVAVSAVGAFYVRRLVELVPFLNLCPKKYISALGVSEVLSGEMAIALVFVGVQLDLVWQLERLRTYIVGP